MNRTLAAISVSVFAFVQVPAYDGDYSRLLAQTMPRTDASMKMLSRSRLGDTLVEGVGYGGVRIGSTETELLAQWGSPAQVTPSGTEKTHLYSLDSGEVVSVHVKNGQVEAIFFMLRRSPESSLRTAKGLKLGAPFVEVRKVYGNPEFQEGREASYRSQGISFKDEAGLVVLIVIFQPGRTLR